MIGFATIGVKSLEQAGKFYDEILSELGITMMWKNNRAVMYGKKKDSGNLCLILPYDKEDPSPGNGSMVALYAESKDIVDRLHKKSLNLGAVNEGDPGKRDENFYGSYIRDLDGNKICFYCRP